MQRTKASEAQVATWLDVAGTAYSEVGQPAQALLATQEAVTLYRELAERYPDRYTPDLAASLRVLTGLLEADDAWPRWQVAIEELRSSMARAHFGAELAKASHQAVPDRAAAALSTAADQATMPDDAGPRDFTVRTRLLVREVAAAFPAAGLPPWVTDPLPDKHLNAIGVLEQGLIDPARLADALVEHADVVGEAGLLHTIELAETVFATDLGSVRGLVEDAQARGLEVAAAELRDLASLQDVVRAWIGTPTWTESVDYLREHPQLRDDAVGSMLASAPGPVAQQHTAILHLANGMDLTDSDTAASLVEFLANPEVAADGAIERLEAGEIDAMTTTVLANPQTLDTPRGPLLLAVLLAARGEPGNAREVIAAFGPTLNPTQRRARVLSLRKLLASNPPSEVATALPDLIALLDNPSPNQPAGASEPGPEPDQAG
ncbi:MAG: hypothetical protein V9G19_26795 [Tetrasphaera sp.]